MFRIVDGREYFYQWDLDRQIAVEDNSIVEVHFCNRTDDCSLVVDVVDGIANVPNILLQSSFDVRVFGYDGKATLHDEVFKVKPRTRPADYVYTETEIRNYEELEARIAEIEQNGISGGSKEVYTLVKPEGGTPSQNDSATQYWVAVTDANTIEFLNRTAAGESLVGYMWKVGIQNHLITNVIKASSAARLTLYTHSTSSETRITIHSFNFNLKLILFFF